MMAQPPVGTRDETADAGATKNIAKEPDFFPVSGLNVLQNTSGSLLKIVVGGKTHQLRIATDQTVLDAALAAGIEVPYGCKAGMCGSCRANVLEGRVQMTKNTMLTLAEIEQGVVLTCIAYCTTTRIIVSWDAP